MSGNTKPARRSDGTFQKDHSGNLKGRPKKDRRITHPETYRDMISDVAEFPVPTTVNGKRRKITLLQANLLTLGTAGAKDDTQAAKTFVSYVLAANDQEMREMARNIKRLDGIHPMYPHERDPVKRAELKEAWNRAVAEATGDREKTTRGLGRNRRKRWPD